MRGDWRIRWRQAVMLAKRPNGRGLTMTALRAAVAISDSFADKPVPPPTRGTWVSQDELVRRTGLYDRKEFKSGYRELVDAGLLRVLTGNQAEAHVAAAMGDSYDAGKRPQNRTVYIPLLPES
ncbi:hypothetical protein [Micromonospora sp. NPDC048887]|uniref:hypothetical protein n=1 Tax=Micromonospora sp. NPDC048887 TaxID=3155614 RepID=UPI0033F75A1E